MKSSLYHLQINIDFKNISFYKDLFHLLGWSDIYETEALLGFTSGTNGDVWFVQGEKKEQTDYDKFGMNHLALRVEEQGNIDQVAQFLSQKSVEPLFETPRHRPDFAADETQTYYQVMFKTADNILFEIVYVGAKE